MISTMLIRLRTAVNKTDFIGQSLGETVRQGLGGLEAVGATKACAYAPCACRYRYRRSRRKMSAKSLSFVQEARCGKEVEFYTLVTAYKTLLLDQLQNSPPLAPSSEAMTWGLSRTWAGVGGELPVDMQVIALGRETAIVCMPGELFVDLGLAIKQASPVPHDSGRRIVQLCGDDLHSDAGRVRRW